MMRKENLNNRMLFLVIIPGTDDFPVCADDRPIVETEEVELALYCNPYELAEYKDAIMAAMLKGTKRHVESMPEKNEKGNVQTGQSHQK